MKGDVLGGAVDRSEKSVRVSLRQPERLLPDPLQEGKRTTRADASREEAT